MSPTSAHRSVPARGFTLVELLVGLSLGTIVMAGIMAAYLFLGRNLTRLINTQEQGVKSRRVLQLFTNDASSASGLTTATDTLVTMTVPSLGTSVTYAYTAGSDGTGTLTRAVGAGAPTTLLDKLTAFDFNYYTESGVATTSLPSIKSVEFSFTTAVGTALSGTRTSITTVSPRVILRNKPLLQ